MWKCRFLQVNICFGRAGLNYREVELKYFCLGGETGRGVSLRGL